MKRGDHVMRLAEKDVSETDRREQIATQGPEPMEKTAGPVTEKKRKAAELHEEIAKLQKAYPRSQSPALNPKLMPFSLTHAGYRRQGS